VSAAKPMDSAPRTPEGTVWHLYELKDVGAAREIRA
jgi:hypothetical protein